MRSFPARAARGRRPPSAGGSRRKECVTCASHRAWKGGPYFAWPAKRGARVARLAALLALTAAAPAYAWGPDGHRVTGEIAWRLAADRTKQALRELLPRGRDGTLAEAAAWADTVARDDPRYRWLEPLHYVNVAPDADRVRIGRDCECVVGAIDDARDRLADARRSRAERLEALRLVAHFVGDVHQPLHVSHPDGRGGNTIDAVFDGAPTNLHRLWDGDLLRRELRERGRRKGPRWRAYAHSLADRASPAERERWRRVLDPRVWAEESLVLARAHAFSVRDGARLGDRYFEDTMPVVSERLAQAGVRLAALLDASFAPIR